MIDNLISLLGRITSLLYSKIGIALVLFVLLFYFGFLEIGSIGFRLDGNEDSVSRIGQDSFSETFSIDFSGRGNSGEFSGPGEYQTFRHSGIVYINGEGVGNDRNNLPVPLQINEDFSISAYNVNFPTTFNPRTSNISSGNLQASTFTGNCKLTRDSFRGSNPIKRDLEFSCDLEGTILCPSQHISGCSISAGSGQIIFEALKEGVECTTTQISLCSTNQVCQSNLCIEDLSPPNNNNNNNNNQNNSGGPTTPTQGPTNSNSSQDGPIDSFVNFFANILRDLSNSIRGLFS